jgi:hypothetical protein
LFVDGIVYVPPIHDIAITDVWFSNPRPAINETISIYVTIENQGNIIETFDVSLNYTLFADPLIGTQTITLEPGYVEILNFTLTPMADGRYEIKAYTSEIPEETDPTDNTYIASIYVGFRRGGVGCRYVHPCLY